MKDTCGRSNAGSDVGCLNLAVAGEIRTFREKKVNICALFGEGDTYLAARDSIIRAFLSAHAVGLFHP